jgi:hypothetical protein
MRTDEDLREAKTAEARARQAVVKMAVEIRPILGEDFVEFPAYEIRRRFVSAPDFAAGLPDEAIGRLKSMLAARSLEVRDAVLAALADPEVWLAGVDSEGPGKSLAENGRLWALTVPVADLVREVLAAFGFPAGDEPIEYRMPMRFIHKKFLPGLAEKYWAAVADLREARARVQEAEEGRVREALGKRWDRM